MSNGGIIGPVNDPTRVNTSELITSFNASGTFTAQSGQTKADVLIVAGGGGGGTVFGGGGGGGGFRQILCHPIPSSPVTITVGAGGTGGGPGTPPTSGNPSIFASSIPLSASGGGKGGDCAGGPGGSGGGGSGAPGTVNPGGSGNIGGFSPPEGNSALNSAPDFKSSGGAGAGGQGTLNPAPQGGGSGGPGSPSTIGSPTASPSPTLFSGGGGGGGRCGPGGSAGPGGGGVGRTESAGPPWVAPPSAFGTVNSGGGGGAVGGNGPGGCAWSSGGGGSGKIVVKEKAESYVSASGVWSLQCQYNFKKSGQWT